MILAVSIVLAMFMSGPVTEETLEKQAREIEKNLIAPCCWTHPVAQHYSETADQIRLEVRQFLAQGKTESQILDHYVSVYGERILASPRAKGFNTLAYVLPWAFLLFGAFVVMGYLRRWRGRSLALQQAEADSAFADEKYVSRLEREIRDLE
jgi:cytochrome c-type biogenesis protein CcmH